LQLGDPVRAFLLRVGVPPSGWFRDFEAVSTPLRPIGASDLHVIGKTAQHYIAIQPRSSGTWRVGSDGQRQFINSDPRLTAEFALIIQDALPDRDLLVSQGPNAVERWHAELIAKLKNIDQSAMSDARAYWPTVLEEVAGDLRSEAENVEEIERLPGEDDS
jgi:hypothetical protein